MKALTLTQPWATLVAIGAKHYETRSWRTSYRGPLLIHAARGYTHADRRIAIEQPQFRHALDFHDPFKWVGHILALVDLIDCIPTERFVAPGSHVGRDRVLISSAEFAFGDYTAGRWAWRLMNVRRLVEPIPFNGSLGLWRAPDSVVETVQRSFS